MAIPEGIETVTAEGGDLKSAVAAAAQQLGIETNFVGHKLDLSHFRSSSGGMVPRDTVKIIAWKSEEEVKTVAAPKGSSSSRRDDDDRGDRGDRGDRDERRSRGRSRDRGDRGDRSDRGDRGDRRERKSRDRGGDRDDRRGDRDDRRGRGRSRDRDEKPRRRGAEAEATEASDFAADWMKVLLTHLDLEGTVVGTGSDDRIHLDLKIDGKAGRLIGKRGATLRSVRRLLKGALENHHGDFELDVDVNDDRPRGEDRRSSDDGDRKRGRGRGRGRDRGEKGKYPEEQLTELAVKAAAKARETGQTITINLELNSYDRRVLHVAVADQDGVRSQSEERTVTDDDGNERTVKYVQVIPAEDGEE